MNHKEQIARLKKQYAIEFKLTDEASAVNFLANNTYAHKLNRYVNSFEMYVNGKYAGQCVHVDFMHLLDLSTIDMRLRKVILSMTLDLEHSLKASLMNHVSENEAFDEQAFITELEGYYRHGFAPFTEEASSSYYSRSEGAHFAEHRDLGSLLEILSFGDFATLFRLYATNYPEISTPEELAFLQSAKSLRNAAAHNAALLSHLNPQVAQPVQVDYRLLQFINDLDLNNRMTNRVRENQLLLDLSALMVLTSIYCSQAVLKIRREELLDIFDSRFKYRLDSYEHHPHILRFRDDVLELIELILN